MDLFITNVPAHVTQKQLTSSFITPLKECGIVDFHCELPRGKAFAFISILNPSAGQRFLSLYGVPQRAPRHLQPKQHVVCCGHRLRCQVSHNKPTEHGIKALELDASKRLAESVVTAAPQHGHQIKRFNISNIHCGMWDYDEDSKLVFQSHFHLSKPGYIIFGQRETIVLLGAFGTDQVRMDVSHYSCDNVTLGEYFAPTITFTLQHSPKFYKVEGEDVLEAAMRALNFGQDVGRQAASSIRKSRVLGLDDAHHQVAGACRVYQIRLSDGGDLSKVRGLLQSTAKMPTQMSLATKLHYPRDSFERALRLLNTFLTDTALYGKMPWEIRFQVDRIARGGYLSPSKMFDLMPAVERLWKAKGVDPVANALRKLVRRLPVPGPDTAKRYTIKSLEDELLELADSYDYYAPDNPYEIVKRYQHINLVHRVVITPTGVYLEGPDPEPTNRVLRRYPKHTDHFIRVVLTDEDSGSVRHDPRASQRNVYDGRFRALLDRSITIAGRAFDFFGFANSALRAHSCWFMAPLVEDGTLFYASMVLKVLGNFDEIRIPAKCAARIGQNFTDTNDTIDLQPESVGELPLVTRNGYDFGDGVGTISKDLLIKVWRVYGTRRLLKPTALQIRFQGAKGMVALDSRLKGEKMLLRSNMKKFKTESSWKLEICGAAFKPLPMFLNRQLIKILEDLNVPSQAFFDLQDAATSRLRYMTESPYNTSLFLRTSAITKATQISSLIWHLGELGLDYRKDEFLSSVVDMAVVTELRDIKYRGRIPVTDGMTLYGIMDETGYLQERQVFVITEQHAQSSYQGLGGPIVGGKHVLVQNNIVITRSPAMHPGDVQLVNAVNVPEDSPLQQLRNVVVFSQHGARDLPSQLSGGDLDGDIYNVIYDKTLRPAITYVAAEYPRLSPVELDSAVTAKDMSEFFVNFMETDQLGMLCNVHMQLADQKPLGTVESECLQIAGMASTAVDFSKTGIAVDMKQLPKYDRFRPDFMAPSPRVHVSETGEIEIEELDEINDDAFEGIDEERRPLRYYKSQKVLGQLYRNIDEKRFLDDMHQRKSRVWSAKSSHGFVENLCNYVLHQASLYGVLYEGYMDLARDIRAGYVVVRNDLTTHSSLLSLESRASGLPFTN
jgi:hypothetical protein